MSSLRTTLARITAYTVQHWAGQITLNHSWSEVSKYKIWAAKYMMGIRGFGVYCHTVITVRLIRRSLMTTVFDCQQLSNAGELHYATLPAPTRHAPTERIFNALRINIYVSHTLRMRKYIRKVRRMKRYVRQITFTNSSINTSHTPNACMSTTHITYKNLAFACPRWQVTCVACILQVAVLFVFLPLPQNR